MPVQSPPGEGDAIGALEHQHAAEVDAATSLIEENERLLEAARQERRRHETVLRQADRRIRAGLDVIRRGTLRVVR